jgi:hypothetical protein
VLESADDQCRTPVTFGYFETSCGVDEDPAGTAASEGAWEGVAGLVLFDVLGIATGAVLTPEADLSDWDNGLV